MSQLGRSVAESATLTLNERAKRLADGGAPVIHLGGGEPNESTIAIVEPRPLMPLA